MLKLFYTKCQRIIYTHNALYKRFFTQMGFVHSSAKTCINMIVNQPKIQISKTELNVKTKTTYGMQTCFLRAIAFYVESSCLLVL